MDEFDEIELLDTEFATTQLRRKRAARRRAGKRKRNRLMQIALHTSTRYLHSPWYDEDKKRVIMPNRGKQSRYLLRQSNKKIRKSEELFRRGKYRKAYDYWWELD